MGDNLSLSPRISLCSSLLCAHTTSRAATQTLVCSTTRPHCPRLNTPTMTPRRVARPSSRGRRVPRVVEAHRYLKGRFMTSHLRIFRRNLQEVSLIARSKRQASRPECRIRTALATRGDRSQTAYRRCRKTHRPTTATTHLPAPPPTTTATFRLPPPLPRTAMSLSLPTPAIRAATCHPRPATTSETATRRRLRAGATTATRRPPPRPPTLTASSLPPLPAATATITGSICLRGPWTRCRCAPAP
mmetsp:Transcript_38765/g.91536  ORF Transcript_38765/g.91536 Transcript_38765/m.91536 type:complete len:245 (+) Transcript_38765:305-1039(+)